MYTIADIAEPLLEGTLGLFLTVGLLLTIILMEALILRGLKWGSLWASFSDSVFVNIVSAMVGVLLFVYSASALNVGWAPLLLILGALTVLIEGVLLTVKKPRHPLRQAWIAAVAINVVSYAFMYVLLASSIT